MGERTTGDASCESSKEGAKSRERLGIMGGTFNPIHLGHLLLAQTARDAFLLDRVLFIPAGCPYMKDRTELAEGRLRLAMTRLAVEDNPYFRVSSMEVEREGNTYSCDTVEALRKERPDAALYFIMGADSLFGMEEWKRPEGIFKECIILAAVRDDKKARKLEGQIRYLTQKYRARISLLPFPEVAISSTDIRNRRKENRSIRYMVPDPVIACIEENGLYL